MLLGLNSERIAILRPRQVYSGNQHQRNSLIKLLRYPKLIDTPNSVSSIDVIEKTVRYVLTERNNWNGIWNIYDRKELPMPLAIGELLWKAGLREQPFRISKEELDAFHKPKRVDTVLYDERFETTIHPEDVQLQLAKAIEELKETSQIS